MIQLTPIAIAATSQQYLTNVVENLCQAYCADNGVQPTGIVGSEMCIRDRVNTQTTVTINAAVLVAYTPKGSCRTVTKQWVEQFKVAFIGAAGAFPTISLTPLVTQVTPENVKCCNRAYGVSLATPLTISATFPAAPGA